MQDVRQAFSCTLQGSSDMQGDVCKVRQRHRAASLSGVGDQRGDPPLSLSVTGKHNLNHNHNHHNTPARLFLNLFHRKPP